MATTAVPITESISAALQKAFKKSPALEELWQKLNMRVDATQKELGQVDVKQQQTQAALGSKASGSKLGGISPWLIVGVLVLLVWWWKGRR
jgi:hypothetical protein